MTQEYTKISAVHERLEELDDSLAVFSSYAAYGLNYNINLPKEMIFTNVYHSNTLDLTQKQVSKQVNKSSMTLNINGWQLPGQIFVATYKEDD